MRDAITACSVPGTVTSAIGRYTQVAPLAGQHALLGEIADDFLGEERISPGPFRDNADQACHGRIRSDTPPVNAPISESASGSRVMVWDRGLRASAPAYSGR